MQIFSRMPEMATRNQSSSFWPGHSANGRWLQEAARPVDFPVTVVQGKKDNTVDWPHNLRIIRNKFAAVEERLIPDGRHHLVNEAKDLQAAVFNTIVDTFDQILDGSRTETRK